MARDAPVLGCVALMPFSVREPPSPQGSHTDTLSSIAVFCSSHGNPELGYHSSLSKEQTSLHSFQHWDGGKEHLDGELELPKFLSLQSGSTLPISSVVKYVLLQGSLEQTSLRRI